MTPKILVIGCGRIAGWHCRAIKSQKKMKLLGVCDLDLEKAKNYSKKFKVPYFTNYRKMLKELKDANTVAIITPSGMHFEHSYEILKKYKMNIIVEKPTFMNPTQVVKIYDLASKLKKKIYPVFQNRYNLAVQRLKKAIDKNELGKIYSASVRMRWCRPQRYYDLSKWRGTFSHDGGALTNQGIHHLDLIKYLVGDISSVYCEMKTLGVKLEVEDTALSIIKFKNGAIGNLEVTTAARPDDFEASISIMGEKGMAQIGGVAVNNLEIFTPNPKECKKYSDDFSKLPDRGRVYGRGHFDFYNDIIRNFNGKKFPVSFKDCLSSINILNAHYVSHERGKEVQIVKNKNINSKYLGKKNDKISNLYRTK
jgi:predicted dehydrogenase